jgi:hypothetical protein
VTNNASQWIPHIKTGTYFERDGVIVEVITVEGDNVVAIEEDTNEGILLSLNQAAELLKLILVKNALVFKAIIFF